jgi:putative phosphoesterase
MSATVLVLADTHLRTGAPRWLPESVQAQLREVDPVLHAGDVLDAGVLDRLRTETPSGTLYAVLGNNDATLIRLLPRTLVLDLEGVRVGMIHDSGRAAGRAERMRRLFPDCAMVVFGHSHEPVDAAGVEGQQLFNPGSPTQRRAQPYATFGLLRLDAGRVAEHRIVRV